MNSMNNLTAAEGLLVANVKCNSQLFVRSTDCHIVSSLLDWVAPKFTEIKDYLKLSSKKGVKKKKKEKSSMYS